MIKRFSIEELMPKSFLLSTNLNLDISEIESKKAEIEKSKSGFTIHNNILNNDQSHYQVFIGLIQSKKLVMRNLNYYTPVETFDDAISTVLLRGRDHTRKLTNLVSTREQASKYGKAFGLEDVYEVEMKRLFECEEDKITINLPPKIIVFYLDTKSQWQVFSTCPDYVIKDPKPVKLVLKEYYAKFYPEKVSEVAFRDSKKVLRVFDYDETDIGEKFFLEPMFSDENIVEQVFVENSASNSDSVDNINHYSAA